MSVANLEQPVKQSYGDGAQAREADLCCPEFRHGRSQDLTLDLDLLEERLAEQPVHCSRTPLRHPKESKGEEYHATTGAVPCCEPGDCC